MVAAASAWAAVRARMLTESAIPNEKLRPPCPLHARPEVARPRAGWPAVSRKAVETAVRHARSCPWPPAHLPSRGRRGRGPMRPAFQFRHQPTPQRSPRRKMERDIPAVVDEGTRHRAALDHRRQDRIGDRAGDRRHRGNETIGERHAGRMHRPGHPAAGRREGNADRSNGSSAHRPSSTEAKNAAAWSVRGAHFPRVAPGSAQTIDRPVLQMQPPVRQQGGDRAHRTGKSEPAGSVTTEGDAPGGHPRCAAPARHARPAEYSRPAAG